MLEESGYIDMWKAERTPDAAGRLDNLKELVRSMGEFPDLRSVSRACVAGHGRRERRGGRAGLDHDPSCGEGAGVRRRLPAGLGGGAFSSPALAGRQWPCRARGGAEACLCRPDPRPAAGEDLLRPQPARFAACGRRRRHPDLSRNCRRSMSRSRNSPVRPTAAMATGRRPVAESGSASRYDTPGWRRAEARSRDAGEFGSRSGRFSGAVLKARSTGTARPLRAFHPGSRVLHSKFGPGEVVAVDGPKLTVDFDKAGRKLVMDSFVAAA